LKEAERELEARRDRQRQPSLPISNYLGEYVGPGYGSCKIEEEEGWLVWSWQHWRRRLFPWQGDEFRISELPAESFVRFTIGQGRVKSLRMFDLDFTKRTN
jgi:hypothetical protein